MATSSRYLELLTIFAGGGSMHSAQTELLLANYTSGMQINGRISAVRRFFCLFVTFDLMFTSLFWIICILVSLLAVSNAISIYVPI